MSGVQRSLGIVAVAALVALAACQGADETPQPTRSAPSLAPVACPPQVDDVLMGGYSCAMLTTSEREDSPPVQLLVTTVRPEADAASDDPVIVVGADLAAELNYAGLAPAADRLERTLVMLNPRGVAGSQPDLSCPEVDELGPVAPRGGVDDWVDAVARCATRLEKAGVDVTAFGESAMAADVLDLVDALGVSSWNMGSWGTSGRVALEVLSHDPVGLRAVFLDGPELPGDDTLGAAGARTAQGLRRVLDACAADQACRALPHTVADVDRIASALDAEPVEVSIEAKGQPVTVALDGELLVRLLRHMLANNTAHSQFFTADAVPAALAAADTRDEAALALLVEPMSASKVYCEGYLTYCPAHQLTTLGAYLSTVCGAAGGPSGEVDLPESVRRTFTDDPYSRACDRWPVKPEEAPDEQIESDVPVLLLTGGWDPFVDVDPDGWRTALGGLSRLTAVQVPGWGHNVLGSGDCAQTMRNSFVADPEQPVDTSCLAELPTAPDFLDHL